ncbi:MAG: protein-S-isoprenylcysteine O-methyltransferase [Pseudomonadota bacterium]
MQKAGGAYASGTVGYVLSVLRMVIAGGLLWWNFDALTSPERVWIAFFFALLIIRLPYHEQSKSVDTAVDQREGQERVLIAGIFLTIWPLPLLYLVTKGGPFDVLSFANYTLLFDTSVLGLILFVPFAYLFWRSHADLGRNWSPSLEMREEHQLVANGVYKRVRHPMYAALWIYAIAQPLLVQNLIAGGAVVVAFAALYVLRVPKEEEMMLREFGDEYRAYMERTGRIFPKFS